MKKLLFLLLFIPILTNAQPQTPILVNGGVDERVELLSIVFRLANCYEYSSTAFKSYVDDINQHFEPYKNHPVVELAKRLREERGVSYDAVMKMAVHLSPPPQLTPAVTFTDSTPEYRWGKENALKFAELLQQFYADADCKSFFEKHQSLYEASAERLGELCQKVDVEWYERFYGQQPDGRFVVVAALGNGGGNYGPSAAFANGKKDIYAILGTWNIDSTATPVYPPQNYLSTLVHEFNHSFVNPIVDKHRDELAKPSSLVFPEVADILRQQAYGNAQTMLYEALVRAGVLKYMADHGTDSFDLHIGAAREEIKGFLQMGELVATLQAYDSNRTTYPTFDSYMPEIVRFYQATADNIEAVKAELMAKVPSVKAIEPFGNGAVGVDITTSEVKIVFDKPMFERGHSFSYGKDGERLDFEAVGYTDNNTAFIIRLKNLKPNTKYQTLVTGLNFFSKEGYPLPKNYLLEFTTASAQ